jgi:predicted molibdopterin-dependent oxidoreductase YjgC
VRTVLSTCPFCACGCGVYLNSVDSRLVGVAPSEHHPVSRGGLCARCWSAHEALSWGERLTTPMIRRQGKLQPASWSEAIDHAASRLSSLVSAGKRVGVLGSARATNEENYLTAKLARETLRTGDVDFGLRQAYEPVIQGVRQVTGRSVGTATLADIEGSDFVLVVEGDLAASHPRAAFSVLRCLKGGGRVVTIGSRRTQLSRVATTHLSASPGAEGPIINGLLAAVLDQALETPARLAARYDGCTEVRRRLESDTHVTQQVREVGKWIVSADRAVLLIGPMAGTAEAVRHNAGALASVAAVAGHLEHPGSGPLLLLGRSNLRGAWDMGLLPSEQPTSGPGRAPGTQAHGSTRADIDTLLSQVSALLVVADDPPAWLPDSAQATAELASRECLVLLDSFLTPSARQAQVLLPIAGFAEVDGTYTSLEGRVQRVRAAVAPPGRARAGCEVLAELVTKLSSRTCPASAADVFAEISTRVPGYAGMSYQLLDKEWGTRTQVIRDSDHPSLRTAHGTELTNASYPWALALDGAFEWGDDPLVAASPTLARDLYSRRKQFPNGCVVISKQDADALGLRRGRHIRLRAPDATAVLAVDVAADMHSRTLLLPFAFRDHAAQLLSGHSSVAVTVEIAG